MTEKTFTKDELAFFDGKDGKKAYVAIEGNVYDVSDTAAWVEGSHHGLTAGKDLTKMLLEVSPHKRRVLTKIPKIGILVD